MIRYDCEDEYSVLQCQIPKLTLQPIVENSIYHGLEQKMEKGHLDIKITATDQHLIIMVSDDGVGMEKEQVKKMNEVLRMSCLRRCRQSLPEAVLRSEM